MLGVRTNAEVMASVLREAFSERLVPHAEPPPNLSMRLAPSASADGVRQLHRLYDVFRVIVRAREVQQLLDGLRRRLAAWDARATPGTIVLDATVLLLDGRAHLLPAAARRPVVRRARHWDADGLAVVDDRWFVLDPQAGTLTLPSAELTTSATLESLLTELGDEHGEDEEVPVGTWPIGSWTAGDDRLSLAARVVLAGRQVLDRTDHDGVRLVSDLAALLGSLPTLPHYWAQHEELPRLLAERSPGTGGSAR